MEDRADLVTHAIGLAQGIGSANLNLAAAGFAERCDDVKERRFPCSVWTEEGERGPDLDAQIYPGKRGEVAETLCDFAELNCGLRGHDRG